MTEEQWIDQKIALIAKEKVVLDLGGGERFTKWLKKYEPLFKDTEYKTFDFDASTKPDVVGDIHAIPLADNSVDAIICSSVLEHVANPVKASEEMYRILKPKGKVFVYIPSIYPYHARKGHYKDYWRIFDDTLEVLFKEYDNVEIYKRGGYFKALFFFLPLQHKLKFILDPLARVLDSVFKTEKRNTTSGYYLYASKK